MMTIPSRPAPPPPNPNKFNHNNPTNASRYTPTTNWDDTPFETNNKLQLQNRNQFVEQNKKVAPPRPPPPRPASNPGLLKKPGTQQSVNILTNFFGRRSKTAAPNVPCIPPPQSSTRNRRKNVSNLPPPPKSASFSSISSSAYSSLVGTPDQLITFDSPPSSPTLTQKSNSDCVSVDSFSSESNYSPNNGSISQAESGFEDDFFVDNNSKDPWDTSDPFAKPSHTNGKPQIAHKPINISAASYYAYTTGLEKSQNENPLCNGKTLVTQQPVFKPTIIRPILPASNGSSGKNSPVMNGLGVYDKISLKDAFTTRPSSSLAKPVISLDLADDDNTPPSPPMPSCPPPPPPAEYFEEVAVASSPDVTNYSSLSDEVSESYGITLYDYEATQDEDLSFRVSRYLIFFYN